MSQYSDAVFINWDKDYVLECDDSCSGYSLASVIGLSFDNGKEWSDFSLPNLLRQKNSIKRRRFIFDLTVIACEVICLLGILFGKIIHDRFKRLDYLNLQLAQLKLTSPQIESMVNRLKVLDSQTVGKPIFSLILSDIFSSLPQGAKVSLIDVQDNGEFSLRGYVNESAQAFALASTLNAAIHFKNVSVKYTSKNTNDSSKGVEFYISGKIR